MDVVITINLAEWAYVVEAARRQKAKQPEDLVVAVVQAYLKNLKPEVDAAVTAEIHGKLAKMGGLEKMDLARDLSA